MARIGLLLMVIAMVETGCKEVSSLQSGSLSSNVDLAPGTLSCAVSSVSDGGTLSVSLTLDNLQPGSPAESFSVDFYLSLSSSFVPLSDPRIGTASVPAGSPAGNSATAVPVTLSIPAGALNQAVYIYAIVDAAGAVTETSKTNNTSAVLNAAVVLVYDSSNSLRTFHILLETYPPASGSTADTLMAVYKDIAGTAMYQGLVFNGSPGGGYAAIDAGALTTGTYYVVVKAWTAGPYAMAVRTGNIDHRSFSPLAGNAQDTYEPDNTPQIWPVTQDLGPTAITLPPGQTEPLPVAPLTMPVGRMANRYAGTTPADWDWFTFTLP
jgi:hypothetical protein